MSSMKKRRTILSLAATSACLAGAGLAWIHQNKNGHESEDGSSIWQVQTIKPSGDALHLSQFRDKPLLLNFWATWCPPCVEELPLLNSFYQQHQKKWHVVALAADQAASVAKFLQRVPLEMPIGIMGLEATTLSRELGNEHGGLPFTVAFDRQGNVAQRKIGQITASDLDQWLKTIH